MLLEQRPKLLSLFYAEAEAADLISCPKDAGMLVMVQVGSVALAQQAIWCGADIITAQGSESGGHMNRGTNGLSAWRIQPVDATH